MATTKTVWGIDIGQCALKALKLRSVDGQLQVEAFDVIEHPKILSEPDADRRTLIRQALEQFLAATMWPDSEVAIAVPGQSSFTRFVKLPPVEAKQIPDIVRFEAEQQIPFPDRRRDLAMADVPRPRQPGRGGRHLRDEAHRTSPRCSSTSAEVELPVDLVQMAPLALYNFMMFDEQVAERGRDAAGRRGGRQDRPGRRRRGRHLDAHHPDRRQQLHRGAGQGLQALASARPRSSSAPPPPASTPARSSRR